MNVTVLGAGGWGTTLSILLHDNGHKITLYEYKPDYAEFLRQKRINEIYLPDVKIPEEIEITSNLDNATKNRHIIVLAVPTQYLRGVLEKIKYDSIKNSVIVNVAKGIEISTLKRVSEIIKDVFPAIDEAQISTLSGPSHAEEVARKIPTAVVVGSKSIETARFVQNEFMNPYFRVYATTDIVGVELGGSLKNVIAIGAGICDGAGFGDNTKAAIMTRGIAEISRLGVALGAKPETFSGLSGMGDVIVTCMSKYSRNRYVGEQIGKGRKLKDILAEMEMVAEGVTTAKSVYQLSQKVNVDVPICIEVYRILYEDKDPILATTELMTRRPKEESI
ncbi:MAG: NAD(P)H-dependent glycerol-3-phosphate dehydrogenase [Ignavibacteria bacterium]|jgi:glycerol-3-phosphate dehydrogenase (NAD(P)+)|nr:NAD(P)H-dependent glycerol-3-phosphate dehydrogenase [Ignavibacteria bacterium]MDH7527814.1 NAD(P)H-dependent glycerol-3-phosphate dehydrogenase [Ignavibacteria bacterium]